MNIFTEQEISESRVKELGLYAFFFILSLIVTFSTLDSKFNKDAPLEHFRVVSAFESFDKIDVPNKTFSGSARTEDGRTITVTYTFSEENTVKKMINIKTGDDNEEVIQDITTYFVKGSVIYFKGTGNDVFSIFPRPVKFNEKRGTMNFYGSGKLNQYYIVD